MKTVLNVKTDKDVKEQAQALAKHLGVPLSVVVNGYLREFVRSGEFTLRAAPTLKPAVAKRLERAVAKGDTGSVYDTPEDFLADLENEV